MGIEFTSPSSDPSGNRPERPIFDFSDWKYRLPHVWDDQPKRWGDIYLMPDEFEYQENRSIWLTINAVVITEETRERVFESIRSRGHGVKKSSEDYQRRLDRYDGYLQEMGEKDYLIDYEQQEMYVRAEHFTQEEMVEWARVYLQTRGIEFPQLREGEREEFAGSNQHADAVEEVSGRYDEFLKGNLPSRNILDDAPDQTEKPLEEDTQDSSNV